MEQSHFELDNPARVECPFLDLTRANISYASHFHRELEVLYIVEGFVNLMVNGKEYQLCKGDIFIVMPGEIHSFSSSKENQLYVMKFYCFGELMSLTIQGQITPSRPGYATILDLVNKIAAEDTEKKPGYLYAINMLSSQLMLEIVRNLNAKPKTKQEEKQLKKKTSFITALDEFLKDGYMNGVTLESAAQACGYSKYHFTRWMKATTNMNFTDYLALFRLEQAIFLLRTTNQTITDIAMDCGFGSLRSFHRLFKKYYHKAPREFRSQEE